MAILQSLSLPSPPSLDALSVAPMTDPPTPKRALWARLRKRWVPVYFVAWVTCLAGEIAIVLAHFLVVAVFVPGTVRIFREHGEWATFLTLLMDLAVWAAFFAASILLIFEWAFRNRIRGNLCTRCRYDLRTTIELGRAECPECGCLIERLK